MKKTFQALNFTGIILLIMISFISCDKDFNSLESDVLGKDNANFDNGMFSASILAYNKKLDSLQINNLSASLLGVFNDPVYGTTSASIITQVAAESYAPNFGFLTGFNPAIDSVVLTIPYFSRTVGTDENGNTLYTIKDSLYGSGAIDLKIYQNNYFLRDFNPNSQNNTQQNYYSKADGSVNSTDNFALTENSLINFDTYKGALIKDTIFTPSEKAIVLATGEGDSKTVTVSVPAFRTKLDPAFWTSTIIEKEGQTELSNDNNFKNYFRGLYFKASPIDGDNGMVLLNTASTSSNIIIYYSKDKDTTATERIQSSYTLNLASTSAYNVNKLNTFINDYSAVNLADGDEISGDDKLYLKGTEGSMAVVDLFSGLVDCDGDGTPETPAIDCFKKTYRISDENGYKQDGAGNYLLKQLINEAQLIIYEDNTMLSPSEDYHKYDRIYAYDIANSTSTIDYQYDPTENTSQPYYSRYISLGQRITTDGVSKYKIRLTEHLNNILIKDSTNTKIGLVLSSNVNIATNSEILNSGDDVTAVPSTSVITPRGTILYGTNVSAPNEDKKMRLEIFFTKPESN